MTALQDLLSTFRQHGQTNREAGTYFEDLIRCYLQNEPLYKDLYSKVETFRVWANRHGMDGTDTGIDLVATVRGSNEAHAVQCKLLPENHSLSKGDLDGFLAISSKEPFAHRVFVSTTNNWGVNAKSTIEDQRPPISIIDLIDLEKSQIDWSQYQPEKSTTAPALKEKKTALPHQEEAISAVLSGLSSAERGKMIMACGTGKTFVSLRIAEKMAGKGGKVLFLVPSLALLSQALTEWTQQSQTSLCNLAVCSDSQTGKKKKQAVDADTVELIAHELSYPATTDSEKLANEAKERSSSEAMTVVFGTYQSIEVIGRAQREHGLADFDLIICDEAHRTTGHTFAGEDESHFVKVHDQSFIRSHKRLYMTATPRIYGPRAREKAIKDDIQLCAMDDESLYGKELYVLSFSQAVKKNLLVDYKVLVLSVDEEHVSRRLQQLLADGNNQLKVDDAGKIVGCWKALAKQDLEEDLGDDAHPMQRAVAFCQRIEYLGKSKMHQVGSKNIAGMFQQVVEAYQESEGIEQAKQLRCEAEHVDGSMGAIAKEEKLQWLKDTPDTADTCRILSNVRCLSEGVDVPALDAVLFLTPRNSQIDVVQSVGRVMRKTHGKTRGYIVLPVVVPAGVEPHEALNDNKIYAVVWQVLQALRSHDDRFDAMINKLELAGKDSSKMEIIAITDKLQKQTKAGTSDTSKPGKGKHDIGKTPTDAPTQPEQGVLEISDLERAIYAKLVKKVGNRNYFEDWATDIAKIANTHIDRIQGILENPENREEIAAFNAFAQNLRQNINGSITDEDIVEMLAQHLITKPVFDTLFADFAFAASNPISQAMQSTLEALGTHNIDKEADTLEGFYDSIKLRIEGIEDPQAKQKVVVELYDKFFRNAFPRTTERLGLVYTPVELVDFIIHSVNHILQQQFGRTLGSEGVHILDPFTGTGTFITRLLQSGLFNKDELEHKYKNELHANEIVLLAYYIAAINIEASYHAINKTNYQPFEGIVLTDTFDSTNRDDPFNSPDLQTNNERRNRQDKLDIRVIISNPPYSKGQKSANDDNANLGYHDLDSRIAETYAKASDATLVYSLYDSYIRSIRWASDRIGDSGIIGFVTNAGWLDSRSTDGLRKCFVKEFSSIYVFNLRGDQRTQGETSRREGGKIFGSGSRTPIAISILVKDPTAKKQGQIFYHDIGDYLSREEKLTKIIDFKGIDGISFATSGWKPITPDKHGDWLNQRDSQFDAHIVIGDKSSTIPQAIFINYSLGIATNRDAWCFNASRKKTSANIKSMIAFYNEERKRLHKDFSDQIKVPTFSKDPTKISWAGNLVRSLEQNRKIDYNKGCLTSSLYRPFTKQCLYFNRQLNERVSQMPKIFPTPSAKNLVICIPGKGASTFSALITDVTIDLNILQAGAQCFPLYLYEPNGPKTGSEARDTSFKYGDSLFLDSKAKVSPRQDAITDMGLEHFQKGYPKETISKEDLFYYVYGILHSPDYRERYAANLNKELPRIPRVKKAENFWAFSKAGRELANLHINYESVEMYPVTIEGIDMFTTDDDYRVTKMKYGRNGTVQDKTKLTYNDRITLKGIPLEAYTYVVNGKPALDWVVERQCVKTDKDSGIVNDANDWAIETMDNPKYPLELFQRVITVSLETMKIVRALPPLDI